MFKSKKKEPHEEQRADTTVPDGELTEAQRRALEKQQAQARQLQRLEAEMDLLGRRT